ncbi:hypothetical protein EMIT0111MI5_50435 [Burkholderia sp. IT-111MI5]
MQVAIPCAQVLEHEAVVVGLHPAKEWLGWKLNHLMCNNAWLQSQAEILSLHASHLQQSLDRLRRQASGRWRAAPDMEEDDRGWNIRQLCGPEESLQCDRQGWGVLRV